MEKKKSEYQKILDLLNEYEDPMISWYEEYDEECGFFILNKWQKVHEEIIIGKTYWFIEWLVRNKKIDVEKMKKRNDMDFPIWKNYYPTMEDRDEYTEYESLLMLLAIQDNPIEFLIGILK